MTVDEAARRVLARARARGVAAEVLTEWTREFAARAWRGRLDQVTHARQGGLGVRVVADGRAGYAYTEDISPAALDWMLDEAIENARLGDAATAFVVAGRDLGHRDLVGADLAAPLEAKAHAALGFEATLREDPRVTEVANATYAEREREVTLASTGGAAGSYRWGAASLVGRAVMEAGGSHKQGDHTRWVTSVHELDPGRTALTLTERTGRLLGARPLRTGRYTAYFEPRAIIGLLAFFWHLWDGLYVAEGKSRLRGRLGERIASPLVTLVDDPTRRGGLASRPFDAEGTPARPATLIEAGVQRAYLTNAEVARTLGVPNSGHAARGYRDVLGIAPSNFSIAPGAGARLLRGVLVTETMGWHAGTNPVSGEFSVQALGVWIEGGEAAYPVENFAVAGDFLALLERVAGVGSALEWELWERNGFGAPLVEVADLSFAGR